MQITKFQRLIKKGIYMEATITEETIKTINLKMTQEEALWLVYYMRNLPGYIMGTHDEAEKVRISFGEELIKVLPKQNFQNNI